GQKHEVSFLCPSPDGVHIAVGYEDGVVRIFNLLNGESNVSFNGHKSGVTVMSYDGLGARLVTGSKDTDVIVWDIINECGLYRLRGHKDIITQALFLKDKNLLVTRIKCNAVDLPSGVGNGSVEQGEEAADGISRQRAPGLGHQLPGGVSEIRSLKPAVLLPPAAELRKMQANRQRSQWWVDVQSCAGGELKVALLLQNNTVETYSLKTSDRNPTANKTARLTLGGHRTDVRTLAFSSDSLAVLSASGDTVKVWNRKPSGSCRCPQWSCVVPVPSPRSGLMISALSASQGHHREVWCLAISPNGDHLVSSSHDKSLRLWERTREPIILEEEREMCISVAGRYAESCHHYPEISDQGCSTDCLLMIHFGQITSNQMLVSVIDELKTSTLSKVCQIRVSYHLRRKAASGFRAAHLISDVLGFNSAALQFLQREIESKEDVMFFADATGQLEEKKKRRRKREQAVLTIA
ncbi:hypothetical protein XENOCAPTIV_028845, partial [Xenoophorus captivus]